MTEHAPTARTILFVLFGPLVWGLHTTLCYASHASLCAAGERLPLLDAAALPWILAGVTIAALAALTWGIFWPPYLRRLLALGDHEAGFVTGLMRILAGLSLLGVCYTALGIVLLPQCLQLR